MRNNRCSLKQTLLVSLLTFELAFGGVPVQAWALEGDSPVEPAVAATKDDPTLTHAAPEPAHDAAPEAAKQEVPAGGQLGATTATPEGSAPEVTDKPDATADVPEASPSVQEPSAPETEEVLDQGPDQAPVPEAPEASAPIELAPQEATSSIAATISVVGIDADGSVQTWAAKKAYQLEEGATAADLTEQMFAATGLGHESGTGSWGYFLNTITSPDGSRTLGWDSETGRYWQLFVNGVASDLGAGSVVLTEGDRVTWNYSAYGDDAPTEDEPAEDDATVTATCQVIGPKNAWSYNREVSLAEGSTAADLTEAALTAAGLTYEASVTSWGWSLDSITSPEGDKLAYNPSTWEYWQLFVDGDLSDLGAGSVVVEDGMAVRWFYGSWGEEVPAGQVVVDPDVDRPAYDAAWSGYKGTDLSGTATAETATDPQAADLVWSAEMKPEGAAFANVSDPIIVNGDIYIAVNDVLYQRDAATGSVKAQAPLAASISYTSRIRYAEGLVLVPLEGGSVQAITADKLVTAWISDGVPALPGWDGKPLAQQNSSTILAHGGYAYLGTTDGMGNGGTLLCLSLATGATRWSTASAAGYYWAGCAMTEAGLVVADDAGKLMLIDEETGSIKALLDLGAGSRANVVAAGDGSTVYATTKDGVLHKVSVSADALAQGATVKVADASTTTPTISGMTLVAAGASTAGGTYAGLVSLVDLTTMKVTKQVNALVDGSSIPGDIKSAPAVVTTPEGAYAYFTVNNLPGSLYGYKLGESQAFELFTPAKNLQNYCMASPIVGADGTLYYANDSATLFAIRAAEATDDNKPDDEQDDNKTPDKTPGDKTDGEKASGSASSGAGKDAPKKDASSGKKVAFIRVTSNTSRRTRAAGSATAPATKSTATGKKGKSATQDKASSQGKTETDSTKTSSDKATKDQKVEAPEATSSPDEGQTTTGTAHDAMPQVNAKRALPLWPIVGMVCGIAILLWALFGRRRKDDKEA